MLGANAHRFRAEIAKERSKGKFTLAELDEEEQNLDRLRRWFRELCARDIFHRARRGAGRRTAQGVR
jgi:hypothetical protein